MMHPHERTASLLFPCAIFLFITIYRYICISTIRENVIIPTRVFEMPCLQFRRSVVLPLVVLIEGRNISPSHLEKGEQTCALHATNLRKRRSPRPDDSRRARSNDAGSPHICSRGAAARHPHRRRAPPAHQHSHDPPCPQG